MIVDVPYRTNWSHKGHVYGECMTGPDTDLMYVNIPKNASSWTKPNLSDWGWITKNYVEDNLYHKTAIVVLRDPVERWLSGIAEYLALYIPDIPLRDWTAHTLDLVFDKISFDDHTERQVNFIHGLDTERCIFLWCDQDYRKNFSSLISQHYGPNKYDRYNYQHVSDDDPLRKNFKELFRNCIQDCHRLDRVRDYFQPDYELIESINFYAR